MARKSPSADSLKLLYVRSGNECAFPECEHPIFNDKGLYIAQLCHIKAANKGGQRYDAAQTDEERSAPENLLFMCHRHHKETDNEEDYSVEKLTEIKNNHELKFTEKGKEASKEMIRQVLFEINYFWKQQSIKTFELDDLKIERDFNKEILDLFAELDEHIETVRNYCDLCAESDSSETLRSDLNLLIEKSGLDLSIFNSIPYYENPFENRNWEMHNIGRPNFFSHISLCINQLKVKTLEELLISNPENQKLNALLVDFRKEFESDYDNSYYVD
ncbi:hypothetical protein [Saccharicrinis aurantiacus]|uniref:hypothetical protein n=1 Tax=Saccharicrinis aurantiacus TaxID=1849719 RepID=UPI00094FF786|nr:hypothetical protein [Saccharicrinis aurantiacus]